MDVIQMIRRKAKANKKTIVLPEYYDPRVEEASRIIEQEGIANVLFLTKDKIDNQEKERYIEKYYQIHKAKISDISEVRKLFEDTLYYATMMTAEGKVDGIVAGASHTTPDVARASIRCLGVDERFSVASSCFIMVVPNCAYGENGVFLFADCGIIPEPNFRQLAYISLAAAEMASKVLGITPRVALLSYSTHGSSQSKSIEKIAEAIKTLKEISPALLVDGELQVDAAIVPEVAKLKYPGSPLGGRANILIFPNLEAGNISYKLVQRLAGARAVGPLLLGLNKPASDLSRGCLVEDIVDCVAATAIRTQ
ncbi:phosphate acetyltransferase [bacterium]|nr:MAG: phosphate acetyltransferase [bacterium]